jgi:hypothetical protein
MRLIGLAVVLGVFPGPLNAGTPTGWGALPANRPRRVVLTSVLVNAIDNALDVVLAHAVLVVTGRQEARTGFDHQVAERVELCGSARMREMSLAQRG